MFNEKTALWNNKISSSKLPPKGATDYFRNRLPTDCDLRKPFRPGKSGFSRAKNNMVSVLNWQLYEA